MKLSESNNKTIQNETLLGRQGVKLKCPLGGGGAVSRFAIRLLSQK